MPDVLVANYVLDEDSSLELRVGEKGREIWLYMSRGTIASYAESKAALYFRIRQSIKFYRECSTFSYKWCVCYDLSRSTLVGAISLLYHLRFPLLVGSPCRF